MPLKPDEEYWPQITVKASQDFSHPYHINLVQNIHKTESFPTFCSKFVTSPLPPLKKKSYTVFKAPGVDHKLITIFKPLEPFGIPKAKNQDRRKMRTFCVNMEHPFWQCLMDLVTGKKSGSLSHKELATSGRRNSSALLHGSWFCGEETKWSLKYRTSPLTIPKIFFIIEDKLSTKYIQVNKYLFFMRRLSFQRWNTHFVTSWNSKRYQTFSARLMTIKVCATEEAAASLKKKNKSA